MPVRTHGRRPGGRLGSAAGDGEIMNGMSKPPVAAITGAAQGIGQRTALLLAERGYALALNDLRACGETLAEVRRHGAEAIECVGDATEEAVVTRFAGAVRERWGAADVLVNNAGVSFIARAEEVSAQDFRRVLEVNLVAPFLMASAFGSMMLERHCRPGRERLRERPRPGRRRRMDNGRQLAEPPPGAPLKPPSG
jgi:NAD(P)-dependent dehydrogenase (short-subunit alcohol dehydrogenase family)